jgi:hypothetical protein
MLSMENGLTEYFNGTDVFIVLKTYRSEIVSDRS